MTGGLFTLVLALMVVLVRSFVVSRVVGRPSAAGSLSLDPASRALSDAFLSSGKRFKLLAEERGAASRRRGRVHARLGRARARGCKDEATACERELADVETAMAILEKALEKEAAMMSAARA